MKSLSRIFFVAVTALFISCGSKTTYIPTDLPVSEIPIQRFDQAILALDTTNIAAQVHQIYTDFPLFTPYFSENIIGIPSQDTAYLVNALAQFINDTVYGFKETNEAVRTQFTDITDIHTSINQAFARLQYLYPNLSIPTITFFISGFNASILFYEEEAQNIAVGVDMYLGSDYPLYNKVVYNYQKYMMRKECIPGDILTTYLFNNFPYNSTKSRLLENMIYRGKIFFLLSQLFPDESEKDIIGYTKEQMQWAKKYEEAIWNLMIDKKHLFSTDPMVLTSYLNDGPFTSEISQESPARLGIFIGWQICESYIKNNPHVSLQELLEESDAQKILELSLYKP